MTQKVAVAIIHGIGRPDPAFADAFMQEVRGRFAGEIGASAAAAELVMKPVLWAPVIQDSENELWRRMGDGSSMDFLKLRRFMIDFAADAIAYQPAPHDRRVYDSIHRVVAMAVAELAEAAGPKAPLCFVAHSLGTIIASNYLYDLQVDPRKRIISKTVREAMGKTPVDRGETLAALYTFGSPLPLWSLRYKDFGTPISVPSPKLGRHHKSLAGEWLNFYDQDDVIGYPLKNINDAYHKAVKADFAANVGGLLSSWNPISHSGYWTDNNVTKPVAASLARVWKSINS